jgi:hypothetical protein
MKIIFAVLAVFLLPPERQAAGGSSAAEACALLTNAEIEASLGESVKDRKPGAQATGPLTTSQCYFATSAARSVSLTVTRRSASTHSTFTVREYWRRQFHNPEHDQDAEPDRRARPIADVGEEAYWTGNRFAGALYVLKGEAFLRISIGGIRDEQARIATSKALALAALKRL